MSERQRSTWPVVWRAVVIAVCVFFAGVNVYNLITHRDDETAFAEGSIAAEGVVVEERVRSMSGVGGRVTTDPVVRFRTRDGREVTFTDVSAVDLGVTVGQRVSVRYMPDNPTYARIVNAAQDTNSAMIVGLFIALIAISSLVALLTARGLWRVARG